MMDQASNDLLEWMQQKGFRADNCVLKPAYFEDTGRGMRAIGDIEAGDTVLEVPEKLIITSRTVMASVLKDVLVGQKLTALQVLCLYLLFERQRGETSEWCVYVRSLPTSYSLPITWSESLVQRLPVAIQGEVLSQRLTVRRQHEACNDAIAAIERRWPAARGGFTYTDYCWAWCTVNSRCVYWLQELHPELVPDGEDHFALVPFLDLLNHSAEAKTNAGYDPVTHQYRITTQTPYTDGSQVFIHYGPHSNTKLIVEYGFILPKNIHNFIEFTMEDVSAAALKVGMTCTKKHLEIITQNNLHLGHGCSVDGMTWGLLTALKVTALTSDKWSDWTECLEDGYISDKHRQDTARLATRLLMTASDRFRFSVTDPEDDTEDMISVCCEHYMDLIRTCHTSIEDDHSGK